MKKHKLFWFLVVFSFVLIIISGCSTEVINDLAESKFELNISIEGEGSVEPDEGEYDKDTTVDLTVTPDSGWTFSHWNCTNSDDVDEVVGEIGEWQILMDSDKHLTAVFVPLEYDLNINIVGNGEVHHGLIATKTSTAAYESGVTVRLKPYPDLGETFSHWEGDLSGNDDPVDIVMNEEKNITAVFSGTVDDVYTVTFTVKSVTLGNENISGANIAFNGENKTTDSNGIATFYNVENGYEQEYTVSANEYNTVIGTVDIVDSNITEEVYMSPKPEEGNRVHFTGVLFYDTVQENWTEIPYEGNSHYNEYGLDTDDFVSSGDYPSNSLAFPKAVATTFDGIAIDEGTRLIIYSEENFQGEILVDEYGPALINNQLYSSASQVSDFLTKTFSPPELNDKFPPSVRRWSSSNMHSWSYGSCRIRTSSDPDYNDDF